MIRRRWLEALIAILTGCTSAWDACHADWLNAFVVGCWAIYAFVSALDSTPL